MTSFTLKSTNPEFSERQKSVFDQLKVLETRRNLSNEDRMDTGEEPPDKTVKRTQRSVTKHFRGKESIFKTPMNPPSKNFIKRIPDFKKNPHKWTKYSLEDVTDEDISDKSNTKAALSFLKQLRDRKSSEMEEEINELPKKIIFKKYTPAQSKPKDDSETGESKPSFRSSKVVMPEYVVGHKAKKDKKSQHLKNSSKGKELKLDHLLENDEDE